MSFSVHIGNRARKGLKGLPAADLRRLLAVMDALSVDPLSGDVVKLKGMDTFRRRVGDYRIIFSIDFGSNTVQVFDVLRRTSTTYR
jgi:mRNA interferase RelE/StbE